MVRYCDVEYIVAKLSTRPLRYPIAIFHIIDLSYWRRRSTMMRLLDTGVHCTIGSAVKS